MTDVPYKVLVLGAGASLAYGFPLGGDLRKRILDISTGTAKQAGIIREYYEKQDIGALTKFRESFRHSQIYSIDAFLGRRGEFTEIGKKCIAAILLECESSDALFSEPAGKDHWYQYLFNQFAQRDWDELTFDDIAIVSFNYDRSLEHFLYVALQSTYGKRAADAANKLKSLRIVHVYGSLCDQLPGADTYLKSDGKVDAEKVEAAAKGLVVIPEGRIESPTLVEARSLISDAMGVALLGFGFDPINVERLSADHAFTTTIQRPDAMRLRSITGTAKGMTNAEVRRACRIMNRDTQFTGVSASNFHDMTCTEFLRHSLFLG